MRLILVEKLVPEGGAFLIESNRIVGRLKLAEDFEEHQGESVNGADDLAGFGYGQRRGLPVPGGPEGMEGAVHDGIAVKQHQKRLFHNPIITERGRKGGNHGLSIRCHEGGTSPGGVGID